MRISVSWALLAVVGATVGGCDILGPRGTTQPAILEVVSGGDQTGTVGTELADPVVFALLDEDRNPVAGKRIGLSVVEGGGRLSETMARTDAGGEARVRWTLGRVASTQRIIANLVGRELAAEAQATAAPGPAAAVEVTPATLTLEALEAQDQLSAALTDEFGNTTDGMVTWSVAAAEIAQVDAAGLVTAVSIGTTEVTAASGGASGSVSVRVIQTPAGLTVLPGTVTLELGGRDTVAAVLRDANAHPVIEASYTWTSSNEAVATVVFTAADTLFEIEAWSGGTASVMVESGGLTDTVGVSVEGGLAALDTIVVTPSTDTIDALGATIALVGEPRDALGQPMDDVTLEWGSSDEAVATVTEGAVTGLDTGSVIITASAGEKSTTASVVVRQVPVTLAVTPDSTGLNPGDRASFKAVLEDAQGHAVKAAVYSWSSTDTAIARIVTAADSLADVEARSGGRAEVVVAAAEMADTAVVTVAPVGSVLVSPDFDTLSVGGTRAVDLEARAADGTVITDPATVWGAEPEAVATVDSSGLVTGHSAGVVSVYGTVGEVADTATLAVMAPSSLLSTAFFGGSAFDATAAPGSTVALPVTLDMSRVGADGALGSAEFELSYDTLALAFDSATVDVTGAGLVNEAGGVVSFAFASTSPQGTPDLVLTTLYFTVDASLTAGVEIATTLQFTAAPADVDANDYSMPLIVTGLLKVTP